MTRVGLPYFKTLEDARRYYAPVLGNREVSQKIERGEIHIGKPQVNAGEVLGIDSDNRNYIEKVVGHE